MPWAQEGPPALHLTPAPAAGWDAARPKGTLAPWAVEPRALGTGASSVGVSKSRPRAPAACERAGRRGASSANCSVVVPALWLKFIWISPSREIAAPRPAGARSVPTFRGFADVTAGIAANVPGSALTNLSLVPPGSLPTLRTARKEKPKDGGASPSRSEKP